MVTKTSVVCWIIGIMGILGFLGSLGLAKFFSGQYMILCVLIVVSAMYFNIKYKEKAKLSQE
jgi:hypothetical protein